MNKIKKILLTAAAVICILLLTAAACRYYVKYKAYNVEPLTVSQLRESDIDSAKKLMITAHPDDEILWGGGHLMSKDYFVVCITNGRNNTRRNEFYSVLEQSGNKGIILEYPDKVMGIRDDWENVSGGIKTDLKLIMEYKSWELTVTHNPQGEYGHQHHKMTSRMVSDIYIYSSTEEKNTGRLMYFGKYYKVADIDRLKSSPSILTDEQLKYKEELLELYRSQSGTVKKLSHMNNYENWTEYDK